MTKPFDMVLFLSGVLSGSKVTQQRHLRQARIMQAAIQQRWQHDNPWTWQLKHVRWFGPSPGRWAARAIPFDATSITGPAPARRLWPARVARGQACAFRGLSAPAHRSRSTPLDSLHRAVEGNPRTGLRRQILHPHQLSADLEIQGKRSRRSLRNRAR
ncbi:MAG TPA: hypothetical protein DIW52_22170 [Pseudomonas sp.]|nr:hypothetical protein [Pseudomonas sp.]